MRKIKNSCTYCLIKNTDYTVITCGLSGYKGLQGEMGPFNVRMEDLVKGDLGEPGFPGLAGLDGAKGEPGKLQLIVTADS